MTAPVHPKWAQARSRVRSLGTRAFGEGDGGVWDAGAGLGVGSPPGAGRGRRGRAAAATTQSSGPGRGTQPLWRRRAVRTASPAFTRAHARPRRPRALRRFAHRAAQAVARRARGRSPGVQRGPRRGPAPRPGRMRPWAARELSRAPAPAPAGPGLRSRSCRPAPERHDFQAAFRLDSLQVRGRRPPPSLRLGDSGLAHHPPTLRAWGRVEGAGPRCPPPRTRSAGLAGDTGLGRRAAVPSSSGRAPGARVGGSGPSCPNFGGPSGLN